MNKEIEKWGLFELSQKSDKEYNNKFKDVEFAAVFNNGKTTKKIKGFYDGDNTYKIRFMPEIEGEYTYTTISIDSNLNNISGSFNCIKPSKNNHGKVEVSGTYHFSYSDGTPYFAMGTTLYAWFYRPEEVRVKTLKAVEENGFNKVRMFVFPKHISGLDAIDLTHEPPMLPYEGEKNNFDFYRFNPKYFKEYDERIKELLDLGVEADIILFHIYDNNMWGLDKLNDDEALFYLEYMIARYSAYRNVWWNLANEYNINQRSRWRDWDAIGTYLVKEDPNNHLRSIHNWTFAPIYPDRAWMTHVCYQNPNTFSLLLDLKKKYNKPVINDEYEYEGNVPYNWGNNSAELTLQRHWLTVMAGGYGTHGECYIIDNNKRDIFWTYGGDIIGECAPRLKYLKELIEILPYQEMQPDLELSFDQDVYCLRKGYDKYLFFSRRTFDGKCISFGPQDGHENKYRVEKYDVWNMKKVSDTIITNHHDVHINEWRAIVITRI